MQELNEPSNSTRVYANFWSRVVAFFLDGIILKIIILFFTYYGIHEDMELYLSILVFFIYEIVFLTSKWQATPGKFLIGLRVTTADGHMLSFTQALLRSVAALFSYALLLPLLLVIFTRKKQTLHDIIAKTVVTAHVQQYATVTKEKTQHDIVATNVVTEHVKEHETMTQTKTTHSKLVTPLIVIVIGFFLVSIATTLYIYIPFVVGYYQLYSHKAKEYDNSFHTDYPTNDYNDTKIRFYNNELETQVGYFIEANELYSRFEYDTKVELARECIDYLLEAHTDEYYSGNSYDFYKNARNKYANTAELIAKAKRSEDLMGKYFYTYDLNMVRHAIEGLVSYPSSNKPSPCQDSTPVNAMYEQFLISYMRQYDESNLHGFSEPQQRETDWYNLLASRFPHIIDRISQIKQGEHDAELKRKQESEQKIEAQHAKIRAGAKEHLQKIATTLENPDLALLKRLQRAGTDLNMRLENGQTALILAAKNENIAVVEYLLRLKVDVRIVDFSDRDAISYIDRHKYRDIYISMKMAAAMDSAPPIKGGRGIKMGSYDAKTDTVTVIQK